MADVLLEQVGVVTSHPEKASDAKITPDCRVVLDFENFGRTCAENVRCLIGLAIPGVLESIPPQESFIFGPGELNGLCLRLSKIL